MITNDQHELLKDIITNTERADKLSVRLDPVSRTMTIEYDDLDDEWFKAMQALMPAPTNSPGLFPLSVDVMSPEDRTLANRGVCPKCRGSLNLLSDGGWLRFFQCMGCKDVWELSEPKKPEYIKADVKDGRPFVVDRRVVETQPDGSRIIRDQVTQNAWKTDGKPI